MGAAPPADWRLQRWTSEDGLAHNSVYALVQDRQGFLWIGTVDGLDRFDGYDFVHYRHDPTDPESLGNQVVRALLEDRDGRLWVGTDDGIGRLDRARDRFVSYVLAAGEARSKVVWCLFQDRAGRVWAGSDQGLFRYDGERDRFTEQPLAGRDGATIVGTVGEDAAGRLWVLSANSEGWYAALHPFADDGSPAAPYPVADQRLPVQSFLFDGAGRLWLGPEGPALVDHERRQIVEPRSSPRPATVTSYFTDRAGGIWFGTEGSGVFVRRADEPALRQYWIARGAGWLENAVRAVYEDRVGAIWLGTYAGLARYDPAAKPFACLRHDDSDPGSLSSSAVSALWEEPGGAVWVGTFGGGLDRLDGARRTITHHRSRAGNRQRLRNDVVWAVRGDEQGRVWVATDDGLCRLDPTSGRFDWLDLPGVSPRYGKLLALAGDESGRLWIGGPNGVHAIDRQVPEIAHYPLREAGADPMTSWVDSLLPDGQGGVWLGSGFGGLRLRHLAGAPPGRVAEYPLRAASGKAPAAEGVWMIHRDPGGRLWAATGMGLSRLDAQSGEVVQYFQRDGLPTAIVYGILEDDLGRLWLSTGGGLSLYDERLPAGKRFRNFDRRDGLCGNEFNRGAALRSRGGEFLFGGVDGLTVFDPLAIHDDASVPPVVLTSVEVAARAGARTVNPHGLESLRLSWRDSSFAFGFAALSFGHAEKNRYAYRLEGLDPAWVEAGGRRYARYTNVAPGSYVFRVRGTNPDGVWNEEGVRLAIEVTPPFWQRAWFRALAAAWAAAMLYAVYRLRVRRLLALERLRLRIAGDLHDDLASELAGIAMATDLVARRAKLEAAERAELVGLRDKALGLVEAVRDTVWAVNPEHDSAEALVRRMRRVAAELLADVPHTLEVRLHTGSAALDMATRRGLFLIFKELVHNAARHARATRVEIELAQQGRDVSLRVADDGLGFDPGTASGGEGLDSLRRRARGLGATLDIDSRKGQGTKVTVRLRLARSRDGAGNGAARDSTARSGNDGERA